MRIEFRVPPLPERFLQMLQSARQLSLVGQRGELVKLLTLRFCRVDSHLVTHSSVFRTGLIFCEGPPEVGRSRGRGPATPVLSLSQLSRPAFGDLSGN